MGRYTHKSGGVMGRGKGQGFFKEAGCHPFVIQFWSLMSGPGQR